MISVITFILGVFAGYIFFRLSSMQLESEASALKEHSANIKKDAEAIANATKVIIEKLNFDFKNSIIVEDEDGKYYVAIHVTEINSFKAESRGKGIYLSGKIIEKLKPVKELEISD